MPLPSLVLVHGGLHAGNCWDLTIEEIRRLEPGLSVLAIDLPGRRGIPSAPPLGCVASHWANSAVRDIEFAGLGEVVVVGHSLAGLTVPAIVSRLGADRVREMILAAALVPPEGQSMLDTIRGPTGALARWRANSGRSRGVSKLTARLLLWNGMSSAQRQFASTRLFPESPRISVEPILRRGMPTVPRTWLMTLNDRALSVEHQRRSITALGGVETVIPVATGHMLMLADPLRVAEILVERCRVYA